ncbi:MAG: SIMPL domain-containing protein [Candidatus Caldarchaeum sp.]|nr:SIMPL domain-containing protein [Candidatus Caldarchaeum sp.]
MEKQTLALLSVSLATVVLAATLAFVALGDVRSPVTVNTGTSSQTNDKPLLSITGVAQTTITPDTVLMTFTIEEKAATPVEAISKLTNTANDVISAILRLGISQDDVKTTSINVYPEYVYREKEPPLLVGYIATYSVEVKTRRMADAGAVIETAINAGADYLGGFYFVSSFEQTNTVYKQLLAAAVADAESKADALLAPLNMRRVGVKSVSIAESYPPAGYAMAQARAEGPPVLPGTTTYTLSVHITYEIAPR